MSGKINLSGKIQMGNGIIFFGEQTLAQDELRIKISSWGVRGLSSGGKEIKLILGDQEYNNWSSAAVNNVNYYFEGSFEDWVAAFAAMLSSDNTLSASYNITISGGDTIIIKRKVNYARLPAPAYLWQPEKLAYATTIITVHSGCTYENPQGSDQSQYLKIFLDNTAYDVRLLPGGAGGYTAWTPSLIATRIATVINWGTTHTATANNNVVTIIANVAETQAATTQEDPNPFTHYSNTWTYTGGTDFATYISGKELTFTPGASAYPITVQFIPPSPALPLWWLTSIDDALADHPFWGVFHADGRIVVLNSENGWTLYYNLTSGESGTAAAPANWSVSTINYISPNETQYTITSFTDGSNAPEIEHSDVLVRGLSPA